MVPAWSQGEANGEARFSAGVPVRDLSADSPRVSRDRSIDRTPARGRRYVSASWSTSSSGTSSASSPSGRSHAPRAALARTRSTQVPARAARRAPRRRCTTRSSPARSPTARARAAELTPVRELLDDELAVDRRHERVLLARDNERGRPHPGRGFRRGALGRPSRRGARGFPNFSYMTALARSQRKPRPIWRTLGEGVTHAPEPSSPRSAGSGRSDRDGRRAVRGGLWRRFARGEPTAA
jgi:hypothetical protein